MMKKEFIVNRQGKDFVLYAGLLDQAHHEGLKRISTKLLQAPNADNGHMAVCLAEVETEKGVFSGIGDASPENVGRMVAMHTIRMAETRAKARALRDAINVGVTAFEELGEADDDAGQVGGQTHRLRSVAVPARASASSAPAEATMSVAADGEATSAPATPQQIDRLHKLQATLGRPALVNSDLSAAEAATQIADLVRIFNAQSRASARTVSR